MSLREILGKIGLAFSIFIIVSPAILFFLWMISLSLKFEIDNAAYPPVFIPNPATFDNYVQVLTSNRFATYFFNTLIVTGTATLLALLVGVPAGFGIARMGAHKSAIVILIARITPGLSYLIPLFLLFQWLGLLGTLAPQIIIHLVVTVPIVIWIMIGYFETTPIELEEAALIDGAGAVRRFITITIPFLMPTILVVVVMRTVEKFKAFDLFYIMTKGGPANGTKVLTYDAYLRGFNNLDYSTAATISYVIAFLVLGLTIAYLRLGRQEDIHD